MSGIMMGVGEFGALWDAIMAPDVGADVGARKFTLEPIFQRILQDRYRPIMRGGVYVGTIKTPDNAAFLRGLAQIDRSGAQ